MGKDERKPLLDVPARYKLVQARTILNRVNARIPLNWTINPYRGCRHACVYCFARPTHTFYGLNSASDFHSQIFVKLNAAELLRNELNKHKTKGHTICLGSVTDPYQPAETRYHLSRQLLEVLVEFKHPLEIITKSPLILRDLELLKELNQLTNGGVTVNVSIISLDPTKSRLFDPGAPSPGKRLDCVAGLSEAGIKTRVFIMPVLPGITDDPDELEELVRAVAQAGAYTIVGDALRLARGLEDYYYNFLDANYPELRPRYDRIYNHGQRTFASPLYREALKAKINQLRSTYGLDHPLAAYEEPAKIEAALEAAENKPQQLQFTFS